MRGKVLTGLVYFLLIFMTMGGMVVAGKMIPVSSDTVVSGNKTVVSTVTYSVGSDGFVKTVTIGTDNVVEKRDLFQQIDDLTIRVKALEEKVAGIQRIVK